MIEGQIRGPVNFADLGLNMALRKFLTYYSTPIRYSFGLAIGLCIGALTPENLPVYAWGLALIGAIAMLWVVLSLISKAAVRKAIKPLLTKTETLSEFQLMHSRSWVAAVKTKET